MRFSVGFQLYENEEEPFSQIIKAYRNHISETFFSWLDIPSGRGATSSHHGFVDWSVQQRTESELKKIKQMGIKLDLLFNANCYGAYSLSIKLSNTVCSVIESLFIL